VKSESWTAPYVAPFFVFMLFLISVNGFFPDQHFILYPIKISLVIGALAWYWRVLPSLTPTAPLASVTIGIVGVIAWIGLDPWALKLDALIETAYNCGVSALHLPAWQVDITGAAPKGRNPFLLYPPEIAWVLFAIRVAGISLCVPVMEELFWRGFLMRWLISEDFTRVPLGTYVPFSFWVTTAFFAMAHGAEWPLAVIVGMLYGFWFVKTKALGNIMLAHGTTNFLLAFY